ncbi:MAG TPA: EAL domain-containing protein [Burkholderiaceae bacterium]|nr:EAL domain-containing protein [Burkholderiaceae bacterium]
MPSLASMQHPPKLVPVAQRSESPASECRLPFEVTPAQRPLVHAVLDWLPYPAAYVDRDNHLRMANQAFAEALGASRDALIDAHIESTPLASHATLIDAALRGEQVRITVSNNGALALGSIPQRNEFGVIQGCLWIPLEISETSGVAIVAKPAPPRNALLHGVLASMPVALAYVSPRQIIEYVNASFCSLVRRHEAQVVGATLSSVVGDALADLDSAFEQAMTGRIVDLEYLVGDRNDNERWRRLRVLPPLASNDAEHGVFVMLTDVHDEKTARLALERRERQVREFSENIPHPVAYLSKDNTFGFVNNAFAQFFGLTRERIVGSSLSHVLGEASTIVDSDIHARVRSGEAVSEERRITLPNGAQRTVEIRWTPEVEMVAVNDTDDGVRTVRGLYLMIVDVEQSEAARIAFQDSVAELRRAMNSIDTPIALIDADECFRFANASMQAWYGLSGEQIVGRELKALLGERLYTKSVPYIARALAGEEVLFEREFMFPGGIERWTRVRYVPQRAADRRITGFYVVIFDVHDLKIQQRELQIKQEELRRANWLLSSHLENSPLAALELDADLNVRRWSERAERLFGWRRDQALNRSIWELSLIADGEVDAITRSFALVLSARQQRVSALQRVTRHDGSRIWCEWYISALADETGEVASIFALVQDVNQRVEAEARLQQLAAYDSLTGLPNRSSLQFELAQALDRARRSGSGVAALFIDLDHFKNVNDTLGHRIGDQLLVSVARILKSCVRRNDLVSRMGGDEFMVVVEHNKPRNAAQHVADKILIALNQPLPVEGHMLTVAASVGIAIFPDHGTDANLLLKNADVAMYHAKGLGKGRFEVYSDELAREREEQSLIEFSLRVAMASNQLTLAYQPRVMLEDGRIEGAEALLRWRHPELGDIPPKKFIRVAEETGLIFELGTWVFRKACQQLREWEREGLPIKTISVNFSARQLLTRDLVDRISNILTETGCDPRRLEVEITETSMMFDITTTKRVISSLKRLGMRIAIDDFGTGFSSLSHLQQLDIDALKIDQSFVRDLLLDAGDAAITRAVIALGRGIGLQVIAEGVENARQLSFLRDCGCDLYQGFHFSPAVPPQDFEALLRSQQTRTKPPITR